MRIASLFARLVLLTGAWLVFGAWKVDYIPERHFSAERVIARERPEYPRHTEKFKSTAEHGENIMRTAGSCRTCHGSDLKGGATGVSCGACHQALERFDHFGETGSERHGWAFLADRRSCADCHGTKHEGRGSAPACTDCHAYPHSGRWSLRGEHGTAYIASSRSAGDPANCAFCHGEDSAFKKTHPSQFISCSSCHPGLPHPKGEKWASKTGGGGLHKAQARKYSGKCLDCHTDMKRLMPAGRQCRDCHTRKNWEPTVKAETVETVGGTSK